MPKKKQAKGAFFVNPFNNPNLGRRTGKDVKDGKNIRVDEDGYEVFDDYWTDSSSESEQSSVWSVGPPHIQEEKVHSMSSFSVETSDVSTLEQKIKLNNAGNETGSLSKDVITRPLTQPSSALQRFRTKKRLTYSDEHPVNQQGVLSSISKPEDQAILTRKESDTQNGFKQPTALPAKRTGRGASNRSLRSKPTGDVGAGAEALQTANTNHSDGEDPTSDTENVVDTTQSTSDRLTSLKHQQPTSSGDVSNSEPGARDQDKENAATHNVQGRRTDVVEGDEVISRNHNLRVKKTGETQKKDATKGHKDQSTIALSVESSNDDQEFVSVQPKRSQLPVPLQPKRSARQASSRNLQAKSTGGKSGQVPAHPHENNKIQPLEPKRSSRRKVKAVDNNQDEQPNVETHQPLEPKPSSQDTTGRTLRPKRTGGSTDVESSVQESGTTQSLHPKKSARSKAAKPDDVIESKIDEVPVPESTSSRGSSYKVHKDVIGSEGGKSHTDQEDEANGEESHTNIKSNAAEVVKVGGQSANDILPSKDLIQQNSAEPTTALHDEPREQELAVCNNQNSLLNEDNDIASSDSVFVFKSIRSRHSSAPAPKTFSVCSDESEDFEMVMEQTFLKRRSNLMVMNKTLKTKENKAVKKLPVKKLLQQKQNQSLSDQTVTKPKNVKKGKKKANQKSAKSSHSVDPVCEPSSPTVSQPLTEQLETVQETQKGQPKTAHRDSEGDSAADGSQKKPAKKAQNVKSGRGTKKKGKNTSQKMVKKQPVQIESDLAGENWSGDYQTDGGGDDPSIMMTNQRQAEERSPQKQTNSSSGQEVLQRSEPSNSDEDRQQLYTVPLNDNSPRPATKAVRRKSSSSSGEGSLRRSARPRANPVAWYKNESPIFKLSQPIEGVQDDSPGTPASPHIPDGSYLMVTSQQEKNNVVSPIAVPAAPEFDRVEDDGYTPPVAKKKKKGHKKQEEITQVIPSPQVLCDQSEETPVQLKSILKRRKSSVVEQRKARQSVTLGTLPSKGGELDSTGSPVHYHEVTRSKTLPVPSPFKQKKVKIIPPDLEAVGLRRSHRTRVKPLDWYRNERIVYERRKSGGFVVADVISPQLEEPAKKKKKKGPRNRKAPKTPRRLSTHTPIPRGAKVTETRDVGVINPDTNEEVLVDCVRSHDSLRFRGSGGNEGLPEDALLMCKALSQPAFSVGKLIIRARQEKPMQLVRKDTMVFVITHGKLAVTIHRTASVLETGDMFFVPAGNIYGLKNLREEEAKLCFFQLKG